MEKEIVVKSEQLEALVAQLTQENIVLKEQNKELNHLLFRTANEIKTSITSTLSLVNLLQLEDISAVVTRYTQRMKTSMQQTNDTLTSIGILTQMTKSESKYTKVNIKDLISKSISSISAVDGFENIKFVYSSILDIQINTNAILLIEALKPILINCIHVESKKEKIVDIKVTKLENQILIALFDHVGEIKPEVAKHAFDIFYKGNSKSISNGIGLFVSKKIIEQLHGQIQIEAFEQGVKIQISLPINYAPI